MIATGKPGELKVARALMQLRAFSAHDYASLCEGLVELEAYWKDKAIDGPDDSSTFTAKGLARGVKQVRQLAQDAEGIVLRTATRGQ